MWIYYICQHGPGHQSSNDDFMYFSDEYSMDDIEEYLLDRHSSYYNVILNFWKVEEPSEDYVKREIKTTEKAMKNLKAYLKMLKVKKPFQSKQKKEEDDVLQRNLKGKIVSKLIYRLHKAGFMYTDSDIGNWSYGKKCLVEPERSKVLRIIRGSECYPSYKKAIGKK